MIATATELARCTRLPRTQRQRPSKLIATLTGLLLLTACAEEPLPQRRLSADDCLTDVQLDRLAKALKRCDQVVAAFPKDPQPLNERFLLHSLNGDENAACRDIRKAALLASRLPPASLDRLLRRDLELRLSSCRELPSTQAAPTVPAIPPRAATSSAAPR